MKLVTALREQPVVQKNSESLCDPEICSESRIWHVHFFRRGFPASYSMRGRHLANLTNDGEAKPRSEVLMRLSEPSLEPVNLYFSLTSESENKIKTSAHALYTEKIYLILYFKKSRKDWTLAQMTGQTPLSVKTRYYKLDYCRVIEWGREEALTHENVMLYSSNNHTTTPPPLSSPPTPVMSWLFVPQFVSQL
jgi:hypothetical protein